MSERKHAAYFCNRECEYFPCHSGADPENFNCLFCFCPLYVLGSKCGGNYTILPSGCKDCSSCTFPHRAENYDAIMNRYADILTAMQMNERGDV